VRGCENANKVLAGLAIIFAMLAIYALSSGPVFAYYCRNPDVPSVGWCRCYQPLFSTCPELTSAYLRMWEVSDIEAFMLLGIAQQRR